MIKKNTYLTKAGTLIYLKNKKIKNFIIPKTKVITVQDWLKNKKKIFREIVKKFSENNFLAIRSSAFDEDGKKYSQAGKYYSELFVKTKSKKKVFSAINKVISKYNKKNFKENEIIIQEMILKPDISGVVFSREPNSNAPYYVVNYDDISGFTDTVTSGNNEHSNKSLNIYRNKFLKLRSPRFKKLIKGIKELEKIFLTNALDVEFCIKNLKVYLLQVRLMTNLKKWDNGTNKIFLQNLRSIEKKIIKKTKKQKKIYGKTNVFGQMPDWNPAEIIGLNPKPLAFSLYKKLITDKSWSQARLRMGYKEPSDKSLMISFGGLPYINTKLSFNSFLPKKINSKISEKLVNYWLNKLKFNPKFHDKIEFDIATTSFSFDLLKKIKEYKVLNNKEKSSFFKYLHEQFIYNLNENSLGSIKYNLKLVSQLKHKQQRRNYNKNIKILIKDCIKLGTIPFSVLARHAFIAKSILNSLVSLKILSNDDINQFFLNINTVTTSFIKDVENLKKGIIKKRKFNDLYGHLRPGTYDILSKRYDELNYIGFSTKRTSKFKRNKNEVFNYSKKMKIKNLLNKFNIPLSYDDFIKYLSDSISSREYAKYIFSKNVSDILKIIKQKILRLGLNVKDASYLELKYFTKGISKNNLKKLREIISQNKKRFEISKSIKLPQLIHDQLGAYIAPFQVNLPNYISNKRIMADIINLGIAQSKKINNKIVLIENADPGFDWIFTYNIKGLITKFGGVNSHMAIRCREFNLPAAIGCGNQIYENIMNSKSIILDCSINKIEVIK